MPPLRRRRRVPDSPEAAPGDVGEVGAAQLAQVSGPLRRRLWKPRVKGRADPKKRTPEEMYMGRVRGGGKRRRLTKDDVEAEAAPTPPDADPQEAELPPLSSRRRWVPIFWELPKGTP